MASEECFMKMAARPTPGRLSAWTVRSPRGGRMLTVSVVAGRADDPRVDAKDLRDEDPWPLLLGPAGLLCGGFVAKMVYLSGARGAQVRVTLSREAWSDAEEAGNMDVFLRRMDPRPEVEVGGEDYIKVSWFAPFFPEEANRVREELREDHDGGDEEP